MFDLSKAYNCMFTGLEENHCRRFVWRWGDEEAKFSIFYFCRVHFRDHPAAVLMELARAMVIKEAAKMEIDLVLTKKLEKGGYFGDQVCGGRTHKINKVAGEVEENNGKFTYSSTISQVFAQVGLKPKVIVKSGKTNKKYNDKLGGSVLGYAWDPSFDEVTVKIKVNVSRKKFCVKIEDDLNEDTCNTLPRTLTLRIVIECGGLHL